ncbi:DUF6153 family protein [Streptomyces apocyni]|uniref:DUF6153 family protein n=1 Tax=Streptomyces apocyni TaxID=2654677 RepID=UPI001E52AE31|nr:DUF6153 family protein [Streptomyces apocyni]
MVRAAAKARWGQLLLLAALLVGLVTMHTLGHPAEASGAATATADVQAVAHMHTAEDAGTPRESHGATESPAPADHGMDPMSVCLAVLSAFTLALLAAAGLPWRRAGARLAPRTWAPYALRPPPPRRSVLSQLSVLRI